MNRSGEDQAFELDGFELVLLKRPTSSPPLSDEEAEHLQARHNAHLVKQTRLGNMRVAGPINEQQDKPLRGLSLYKAGFLDRARELASGDPSIVAGRLELDVMYFY
jgi:uncharacterized protein YciI